MERITIEVTDDGRVTVMAESPDEDMETMEFETVAEAADAVRGLLMEEQDEAASMWEEEADARAMERMNSRAYE